ncbi:Kinesin-2 [Spironucleus salmonicida]|uniref:Kinesin-2 n=1 Tax=Spironucleus salmonicida TaxID=348837 RepID=V6LNZ9_9EUKA|nr:Kinesin-2 [Spironucleus salmonicida]|eukprot:EST45968.1 Kinesin-2 [Spironucleus salmonicida]
MEKIKVFLRIRPSTENVIFFADSNTTLRVNQNESGYHFDQVLDQQITNSELFALLHPPIHSFLDNFNTTILAYGQSNSGKTHTMLSDDGLVFQSAKLIFQHIKSFKLQILELYNEQLIDLSTGVQLTIFEKNNITQLKNASETLVNPDNFVQILKTLLNKRAVSSTKLNQSSSRSHLLIRFINENNAILTFADLAGSEKQSKTQAEGQQLKEANNINSALLSLSKVVFALANSQKFIPFRDSKLTRMLQNSLGGNSNCYIIGCISGLEVHKEESLNSIKFCQRAMDIQNQVVQVKKEERIDILELKREIERLQGLQNEPVQKCDFGAQEDKLEVFYGDLYEEQHQIINNMVNSYCNEIREIKQQTQIQQAKNTLEVKTQGVKEMFSFVNKYVKRVKRLEQQVDNLLREQKQYGNASTQTEKSVDNSYKVLDSTIISSLTLSGLDTQSNQLASTCNQQTIMNTMVSSEKRSAEEKILDRTRSIKCKRHQDLISSLEGTKD